VRRLRGQIDAIERAVESETDCTEIMRQLSAVRGAINGVMAEVVEDHIQLHMVDKNRKPTRSEKVAADELVEVLRSYIK
jgi:DNA-binding FrmR family transcriptional regulator